MTQKVGKSGAARRGLRKNRQRDLSEEVKPKLTRYVTQLVCMHDVYYDPPPKEEDIVYCRRCGDYRGVTVASAEWIIRDADSGWTRRYGTDEVEARRGAAQHVMRYPTHTVRLWHGGLLRAEINAPNAGNQEIPGIRDELASL